MSLSRFTQSLIMSLQVKNTTLRATIPDHQTTITHIQDLQTTQAQEAIATLTQDQALQITTVTQDLQTIQVQGITITLIADQDLLTALLIHALQTLQIVVATLTIDQVLQAVRAQEAVVLIIGQVLQIEAAAIQVHHQATQGLQAEAGQVGEAQEEDSCSEIMLRTNLRIFS